MAKKRPSRRIESTPKPSSGSHSPGPTAWDGGQVEYTGRQLVLMREDSSESDIKRLMSDSGIKDIVRARDFAESAVDLRQASTADAIVFDELKVLVVQPDRG